MIKNIVNLGDSAIYCDFGDEVNKETNLKVIKYFKTLKDKNLKGVTNLSPSYNKLIVTFDLNETSYDKLSNDLTKIGHKIMERKTLGRMDCILVREDGTLEGGADKRGDNIALGY